MKSMFRSEVTDFIFKICKESSIKCELVRNDKVDIFFAGLKTSIKFHTLGEDFPIQNLDEQERTSSFNMRIVHIWEDMWHNDQSKIESRIRSILGTTYRIFGRETSPINLNNTQLIRFLDENHLNVPLKAKYKYGLTNRGKIVAVMSFSKGRNITRSGISYKSYELLRFCNKLNITVVGGFSKLLNHFIQEQNPDDVMTYVDADWSDGHSLKMLNFDLVEKKGPMEFWLNTANGLREYPQIVLTRKNIHDFSSWSENKKNVFLKQNGYERVKNSGSFKDLLDLKAKKA